VKLARRAALLAAAVAALGSSFGAQRRVLPFGLKAGPHAVRAEAALWTPQDSGRFPVVIVATGGPAALEQPLSEYLASHGYRVVRAPGASVAAVAREFDDSTPVAIITWSPDSAATATLASPSLQISILALRPIDPRIGRLHVVLPPLGGRAGAAPRRYRTLCAVTQAMLNATLEGVHPTLSELAERLRAAGVGGTYIRAS
jgi:hypothetical protein